MNDDVIVCRCSDLNIEEIRELINQGYRTIDELKRIARLAMGPCQGRNCIPLVMRELSIATGIPISEIEMSVTRPIVKSIKLGQIAEAVDGLVEGGAYHD